MILISYVQSNDRWIRSNHTNYASALAGANLQTNEDNVGVIGQTYASSENMRYIRQYFMEYQHSIPADQQVVSGYFAIRNNVTHGTNVNRNWEMLRFDFGSTVTNANWRTPAQLQSLEQSALLEQTNSNPASRWTFLGHQRVYGELYTSGTLRYVMVTNRNRTQSSPTQVEYNSVISSRAANTAFRPHMVVGSTTRHSMLSLIAAQIQLSDGSWIVLERDTVDRVFSFTVRRITPTDSTVIYVSPPAENLTTTDNVLGAMSYSMCRDNNDNFFIVDASWSAVDRLNVTPFVKGSGNTWTRVGPRVVQIPSDHGRSNVQGTSCAWHPVGSGRILAIASLDWGIIGGSQDSWVLLDSQRLISGSGTWTLDSGRNGTSGLIARPANIGRFNPVNSTGTLIDVVADDSNPHTGYIISGERSSLLGETGAISMGRYQIHSGGLTLNTNTTSVMDSNGGFSVYDPDSKARVINVGSGRFVKVTADDRPDWGLTVDHTSIGTTASNFSKHAVIRMDREGIATVPDGASIGATQLWDSVWYPVDNNVWLYYFDADNDRRLMRTAVSLSDNLPLQDVVEVDAAVGDSGDTVHAIRVQRNRMVTDQVLITVALEDSGGDFRNEYIVDRINVAPTQPTLTPVQNFDSDNAQLFQWIFNDPNLVDSQTAFQIEFINADGGATEYDSGKTASGTSSVTIPGSTLDNNKDYIWRVRTWDIADAVSPWSDPSSFSTSNTGIVDITSPSTDNDPNIFTMDYLVQWELVGGVQEEYRLRVIQTLDGLVQTDTGWVSSSASQHLVTGLLSDVEYRIEVTTRSSMVESNVATRLLTTHYATPESPILTVTISNDVEFVQLAVENPEPRGDRPNPDINEIYRRPYEDDGQYLKVGECAINGSFRDYTVASGTRYEYKARAGVQEGG